VARLGFDHSLASARAFSSAAVSGWSSTGAFAIARGAGSSRVPQPFALFAEGWDSKTRSPVSLASMPYGMNPDRIVSLVGEACAVVADSQP